MNNLPIGFAKFYYDAEQNAVTAAGGLRKFLAVDRLVICQSVDALMIAHKMQSVHAIAKLLASADPSKQSKYDRHAWRLRQWLADFHTGKLQREVDAQPKPVPAVPVKAIDVVKRVQPAAVATPPNVFATQLAQNLRDTVKSVCKSGLKNSFTEADLLKLLTSSLKEAGEEYTADQHQLKLSAFLNQHGIDKGTALDILQRL